MEPLAKASINKDLMKQISEMLKENSNVDADKTVIGMTGMWRTEMNKKMWL